MSWDDERTNTRAWDSTPGDPDWNDGGWNDDGWDGRGSSSSEATWSDSGTSGWDVPAGGRTDEDWMSGSVSSEPHRDATTSTPADREGRSRETSSGVKIAMIGAVATLLAALIGAIVVWTTSDRGETPRGAEIAGSAVQMVGNPCCKYAVRLTSIGYRGDTLTLEYFVIEETSGQQTGLGSQLIAVDADNAVANPEVDFSMDSLPAGTYTLVFQLRGPTGDLLDRREMEKLIDLR